MLGIARRTISSRIKEEQKAQRDYGKNLSQAKKNKDKESARVLSHIKVEEEEHESMLRKLGKH